MKESQITRRDALRLIAGTAAMANIPAWAQGSTAWPARPIKIVVPVASGGIIDLISRSVSHILSPKLGQSLVVESKPGADHRIGIQNVAKSAADGYTWLSASTPFTVNMSLRNEPGYDALKDFRPLCLLATSPNVLVVHPDVKAKTVAEFVQLAKSQPGKLTYANPGNGSSNHLGMELFKAEAGLDILGVPYKGQPPAVSDLLAGRLDCMLMSISLASGYISAGTLRPLALVAPERSSKLADVPTIGESGYPGVDVIPWFGLLVPADTPDAIVKKASTELQAAMNAPDLPAAIEGIGATPYRGGSPEEFEKRIRAELGKWPSVISRAGLQKT